MTIWLYLTILTLSRVRPKQSVTCNLATFYTNFFNECVVAVSKETMAEGGLEFGFFVALDGAAPLLHAQTQQCVSHTCVLLRSF